jgi:hypothetical protein
MGGFIVQCDGKMVTMPFEGNWMGVQVAGAFSQRGRAHNGRGPVSVRVC